ncbi:hypothetical protein HBB16_13205 [Pseudonocardia sp. MCCB 268]|nr:hypothetical protein [Pseudonocardia cytotoxica]
MDRTEDEVRALVRRTATRPSCSTETGRTGSPRSRRTTRHKAGRAGS